MFTWLRGGVVYALQPKRAPAAVPLLWMGRKSPVVAVTGLTRLVDTRTVLAAHGDGALSVHDLSSAKEMARTSRRAFDPALTALTWLADGTFVGFGRERLVVGSLQQPKLHTRVMQGHGHFPWFEPVSAAATRSHLAVVDKSRNALWVTTLTTAADGCQTVDSAWRELTCPYTQRGTLVQVSAGPYDSYDDCVLTNERWDATGITCVRKWRVADPRYATESPTPTQNGSALALHYGDTKSGSGAIDCLVAGADRTFGVIWP